jgi:hypothetical protein
MHGVCYHSDHVHIYARSNEHIDFHAKLYIAQAKFSTKHNVSNTIEASWLKGVGRKLLMRMGKTFRVIALVTKVYLNWTKIIDLLLLRWIRSCISVSHLTWAVGSRPGSIYVFCFVLFCFCFCFCFVLFFLCLVFVSSVTIDLHQCNIYVTWRGDRSFSFGQINLRFNDVLDNQLHLPWKKCIAKLSKSIHQRNLYIAIIHVNNDYS